MTWSCVIQTEKKLMYSYVNKNKTKRRRNTSRTVGKCVGIFKRNFTFDIKNIKATSQSKTSIANTN